MKIALIGATGFVGSGILSEALDRGHDVTAIERNPDKLPTHRRLKGVKADVADRAELASLVAGHDVVISAFNPGKDASGTGTRSIIDAVKQAGVARLVVVGGAGSLEVAPGQRLVDQPEFPAEWKDGSLKTAAFLEDLRGETELNWTFLCPAAMIAPGERTGTYRVGGDQLLTGDDGQSRISIPDYAVAMLDEVETPQHPRQRFSVAY
ncbi:NAD(P)-dependent oxidoreductase [uncultured Sphingomonas sp.]|uniref:NAD(P)-dependent oxidoreductase n=1 Tax=uncultured Sphingomonas sp. TaxID=158754 RepID=UPI0035CAB471